VSEVENKGRSSLRASLLSGYEIDM
jgi:hypothetical protein